MKKLLMLGTSYASCEMIRYAKSIGIYTIVTDYLEPKESVAKLVSDEYWMINTADIDALTEKCKEEKVDAVCCGISEFNLERVLDLCNRLGLKSYCTPSAWHFSRDKEDFKVLCKKVDAPVAKDYILSPKLTEEELNRIEFPVVVKPVDLSGNRGISYCYNKDELIKAYKYALSCSKSDKIIVEKMLYGEEWYATYACADGCIRLLALNAMYAQPGEPKNCYTITTTISNNVERFCKEMSPKIEEVLKEVGCTDGIAWVQVMLDSDNKFYIIEMGYRMDGEMMFMPYKQLIGFDTIKWLVETALGIKHCEAMLPSPQNKAFVEIATGMELWTNKAGIIAKLEGYEELAKVPGFFVENLKQVGNKADAYRPVGVVTFCSKTFEEFKSAVERVNETIHCYDENGDDLIIKYTDFDYLKRVYEEGLQGK